jgi:hypothetical protein
LGFGPILEIAWLKLVVKLENDDSDVRVDDHNSHDDIGDAKDGLDES